MNTPFRCERCKHVFPGATSRDCPGCGSEDVFPCRRYHCAGCDFEGEESEFFPDYDFDEPPLLHGIVGQCPNCGALDTEITEIGEKEEKPVCYDHSADETRFGWKDALYWLAVGAFLFGIWVLPH